MNILCKMIEEIDFKYKRNKNNEFLEESYIALTDKDFKLEEEKLKKLVNLRKEFNSNRNFKIKSNSLEEVSDESRSELINEFYEEIRNKALSICSNSRELSNYLIYITYKKFPNDSKDFAWHIGIEGILEILESKSSFSIEMPVNDNEGEDYLGKKYSLRSVVV